MGHRQGHLIYGMQRPTVDPKPTDQCMGSPWWALDLSESTACKGCTSKEFKSNSFTHGTCSACSCKQGIAYTLVLQSVKRQKTVSPVRGCTQKVRTQAMRSMRNTEKQTTTKTFDASTHKRKHITTHTITCRSQWYIIVTLFKDLDSLALVYDCDALAEKHEKTKPSINYPMNVRILQLKIQFQIACWQLGK